MTNLLATGKESPALEQLRTAFLEDAPGMARDWTDKVRAENSAAGYRDWFATVGKMLPGLQTDPRGGYENLQTISVTFGENFSTSITTGKVVGVKPDPMIIDDAVIKPAKMSKARARVEAMLLKHENDAVEISVSPPAPEVLDKDAQELMELLNGNFTPL